MFKNHLLFDVLCTRSRIAMVSAEEMCVLLSAMISSLQFVLGQRVLLA